MNSQIDISVVHSQNDTSLHCRLMLDEAFSLHMPAPVRLRCSDARSSSCVLG